MKDSITDSPILDSLSHWSHKAIAFTVLHEYAYHWRYLPPPIFLLCCLSQNFFPELLQDFHACETDLPAHTVDLKHMYSSSEHISSNQQSH